MLLRMEQTLFFTFLQSILIGLSLAAPVGPIGILTIRRTLVYGRVTGFASGLGTATADAMYGLIGTLGLTAVSTLLINSRSILAGIGGLFLCYLGVQTMRSAPASTAANARLMGGLLGAYLSAFLLTLTNPLTILTFGAILASLTAQAVAPSALAQGQAIMLVLGVFLGSALWWLALSFLAAALRHRLTPHALRWVNRLSGLVMLFLGVMTLGGLLGF